MNHFQHGVWVVFEGFHPSPKVWTADSEAQGWPNAFQGCWRSCTMDSHLALDP